MRILRRLLLPTSVALIVAAAWTVPLPLFLEAPGDLVSLGDRVEVHAPDAQPLAGEFLFATVNLTPGTTADLARAALDDRIAVVPSQQLLPPGVDEDDFFERQRTLFDYSADVAAAVAMRAAGYPADPEATRGDGAVVVDVLPGAPADGVLRPGDVITAVDGRPIETADQLREAVDATGGQGAALELAFRRDGQERRERVTPRLLPAAEGPAIGILIDTLRPRLDLPVAVDFDAAGIGGPSAGLMIAVTVFDKLRGDVDLAAGRVVVGTGTMGTDGRVGSIGGLVLKVAAADRRDADLFLAPAAQLGQARRALPAGSHLQVLGVETFDDAVLALRETAVAPLPPAPR
ncbi:MAG TPA: PDZ domain-containing protein [Egibacteraceae bacterium]|nr:PDZ domain-containing protein [Egibacteraceae bacterium]